MKHIPSFFAFFFTFP
ncbi:TPA: pheA operon leader peptide PheL [Escherichia coli]|nr:hypothetical protein [Shigella flexneri]